MKRDKKKTNGVVYFISTTRNEAIINVLFGFFSCFDLFFMFSYHIQRYWTLLGNMKRDTGDKTEIVVTRVKRGGLSCIDEC